MKKYRIVRDNYLGYEIQCKRLWFPFWVQCGFGSMVNTWASLEEAQQFIKDIEKPFWESNWKF